MRLASTIPLALAAAFTAATVAPRAAQPRATPALTIEHLIDIKHPSNPVWSRDSRRIAFTWERAGVANLFVVPADGSAKPAQVTTDGVPGNIFWSVDPRRHVLREMAQARAGALGITLRSACPPKRGARRWEVGGRTLPSVL